MKKFVGFGIATAFVFGTFSGVASAGSSNHSTPGTPGAKNCVGQTMAYLAQGNETGENGIGNVASFAGLSVQEVKAIVVEYCAG